MEINVDDPKIEAIAASARLAIVSAGKRIMNHRFYITTPIYYPSGEPHLGHVYTTVAADAVARFHRLRGDETFFLTGTDEHGIKMVKTAAEKKLEPRELADNMFAIFEGLWKEIGITHDDFIRTTQDRHKLAVQEIVRRLLANDDIYLGSYAGWYDEGQEEFVTETEAKENEYKSAVNKKPLTRYSENSYFFRLTKYAARVQQHIESHPGFIQPESRRNEVLSKLKQGVTDLSISRATLKWGIPLPNDAEHVVYVWIDALSNYITALGYASGDESLFKKFWPADVHVIGKEILWFHTVYWPAMLFSLGLDLPRMVYAHGWWTSNGEKMGKSTGNFIGLEKLRKIIKDYSLDALRYYLLRAAPFGSDLDWTDDDFKKSFNELANVLGNCLNRLKMLEKINGGFIPAANELQQIDRDLLEKIEQLPPKLLAAYERLELQQCAMLPLELARATNGYFDATEPWKLKDPTQAPRRDTVLNVAARAVYRALVCLLPILPEKASTGLRQMNVDITGKTLDELLANTPAAGSKLGEIKPLFPKIETPA
jgi:methionyl-tRNA synthetase